MKRTRFLKSLDSGFATFTSLILTGGIGILYFSIIHLTHLSNSRTTQKILFQKVYNATLSGMLISADIWHEIPTQNHIPVTILESTKANTGVDTGAYTLFTPSGTRITWIKSATQLLCNSNYQHYQHTLISDYVIKDNQLILSNIQSILE